MAKRKSKAPSKSKGRKTTRKSSQKTERGMYGGKSASNVGMGDTSFV